MKQGKLLVLLLMLLVAVALFTGCSPAEKEFYQIQKESSQLKIYESTGEIQFQMDQLPQELIDNEDPASSILPQLLKHLTFPYSVKVDTEKQLMTATVYFKLGDDLAPQEILSIFSKDHMIYIKIDHLLQFFKALGIEEDSQDFTVFEDKKYLSISEQELLNLLGNDASLAQTKSLENIWDVEKMKKQQELYQKIMAAFMNAFDQYETGIVKKQGNKFVISLTADNIVDVVKPLLVYSVENVDKLATTIKTTIQDLDDEELMMLGLDPQERDVYIQTIDDTATQIKMTGPELITQFEATQNETAQSIHEMFGDSKITVILEKSGSNKYDTQIDAFWDFQVPEQPDSAFTFSFKMNDRTAKSSTFDVPVPAAEDIMTFTDWMSKLPKEMDIEPEYGYYTLTQGLSTDSGEIDTTIINNRTIVPLRQVAEAFQEKIGWDSKKQQAFVEQNGERIYLSGTIRDGSIYVYIKEFEKLGYTITWDSDSGTITLKK